MAVKEGLNLEFVEAFLSVLVSATFCETFNSRRYNYRGPAEEKLESREDGIHFDKCE